ncbi:MAG TPA: D-aminoacyl-tRNA deacylase [Planctomycetota bacterium]|nr:D-aminoacyl-tRNA deacylase [Planctomycetota bacterium]
MRAVIQRVSRAAVRVDARVTGEVGAGLLVLLGVATGDEPRDADWLAEKTANLRIFPDDAGKMNRSVLDTRGGVLAISQFTLLGDARHGRRPEFTAAARPEVAEPLYDRYCARLVEAGVASVARGVFRAHMEVELVNDGPVTLIVESPRP